MARILVADDDSSVRQVLRHTLESNDHRVWEADDGDMAAHVAIMLSFDLVILDLVMVRTSGTQAAREIRCHKPNQKMILMSGIVSLSVCEFREMAAEFGIHSYLSKPFHANAVMNVVNHVLSAKPE